MTSLNLKRRHLSVQQLAAVGAELAERLAEAAKQRRLAGKPWRQVTLRARPPRSLRRKSASRRARSSVPGTDAYRPQGARQAKAGTLGKRKPAHKPGDGDRAPAARKRQGSIWRSLCAPWLARCPSASTPTPGWSTGRSRSAST